MFISITTTNRFPLNGNGCKLQVTGCQVRLQSPWTHWEKNIKNYFVPTQTKPTSPVTDHSALVWLTKEADDEAVVVAVDVRGRVGLELDGDVGGGGVELEVGLGPSVLTQHFGVQVVPVIKGHQVVLADVQPETGETLGVKSGVRWSQLFPSIKKKNSALADLTQISVTHETNQTERDVNGTALCVLTVIAQRRPRQLQVKPRLEKLLHHSWWAARLLLPEHCQDNNVTIDQVDLMVHIFLHRRK